MKLPARRCRAAAGVRRIAWPQALSGLAVTLFGANKPKQGKARDCAAFPGWVGSYLIEIIGLFPTVLFTRSTIEKPA